MNVCVEISRTVMAKSKKNPSRINQPLVRSPRIHSTYRMTAEGLRIIKKLESIAQESFNTQQRLYAVHPNWIETDARITVFSKLYKGLTTVMLSVVFIENSLQDDMWWKKSFPNLTPHDIETNKYNFVRSTKHNFGMLLFILVENKFRIFLRAIDPLACSGGTEAFESIYTCLLRSKLSNPPPEAFELLELIRLVRNTIHNDGVYLHKKGSDDVVTYKGVDYAFHNGKPIQFVTWEFLLMLATDLQNLFAEIISDKVMAEINGNIIDPTYNA